MKFTPALLAAAILAGLLHDPEPAYGQSNELKAIQALQRDYYDLQRKVEELKSAQFEKSAQTDTLIKQLMDANAALTGELKALQDTARRNQTDQQTKVIEPLAAVRVGNEAIAGDVSGLLATVNTMRLRQEKLESLLTDLRAAVNLGFKELTLPPPAPVSAAPSASDAAAILFASAQSDRLEGKGDFALATFKNIADKYTDSPLAPKAMYEVGNLYAENEQYPDALLAFDSVLERFGDNPMRKDAQFRKAEQLAHLDRRADAAKEYNAFARQYPGDIKAADALARAKALTAPAPAKPKAKAKNR